MTQVLLRWHEVPRKNAGNANVDRYRRLPRVFGKPFQGATGNSTNATPYLPSV
jgi:hypothetical protein